jgi:hypothetical protein
MEHDTTLSCVTVNSPIQDTTALLPNVFLIIIRRLLIVRVTDSLRNHYQGQSRTHE